MKEVARLAGVSTMTVSRALTSPGRLSEQTLRRVREVIDRIGYVPNRVAGNLSSDRTTLVALIVPNLRNAILAETIKGINDVLFKHDFQLMISDCANSPVIEEKLVRTYLAQQVCGIILHNTMHTPGTKTVLRAAGIPCVETGNLIASPLDMIVSYSNSAAGSAMARHFAERGYRRPGLITLKIRDRERIRAARRGFLAGLRTAGLSIDRNAILEVDAGLESAGKGMAQLLEAAPRTDAVYLVGDVLAAGALFECQRRGLRVPDDIALASSDDSEWLANLIPAMTTVRYPRYEIGVQAAQAIVDSALGRRHPLRLDLGFEILQRQST
ncbi:LacI family DNA-binding transcriptional regulator [Pigmentiphaga soli]|uniref:LacI family DNA-binding transcriptional regulator n=1 Tax=Pigmentiphaga soli TaxID=1007095 RepID=A0ABP8HQY8_9BURK